MDLKLEGKQALVTGSTAGIGFAIAAALAKEGASVVVNGRTEQRVKAALKQLQPSGTRGKVEGLAANLGTAEGVQQAIARFPARDILVNNLGIFEVKPFEQISDDDWFRFFETNVLSGVRLSRHYLPGMKQRNLGPHRFHFERECGPDSRGDDPLRHDQDRTTRHCARAG